MTNPVPRSCSSRSRRIRTLQDMLVDETAKLDDAATRAALRRAFVDGRPAKLG